jgi:hypothetical protein
MSYFEIFDFGSKYVLCNVPFKKYVKSHVGQCARLWVKSIIWMLAGALGAHT